MELVTLFIGAGFCPFSWPVKVIGRAITGNSSNGKSFRLAFMMVFSSEDAGHAVCIVEGDHASSTWCTFLTLSCYEPEA
jgi:hypothetical protein